MTNKLTVTVGICALNEEKSIQAVIRSVLKQRGNNFTLKKIHVISDGSSDNTAREVLEIKDSHIELQIGKTRLGMNRRLNQIFAKSKTDVLIKLDADILPVNQSLISQLVAPFKDPQVGYVSGKLVSVPPTTFLEKSINSGRLVWDHVRMYAPRKNEVYRCAGPVYALSKRLVKNVRFPKDIWADIGYLYFYAITKNFKFEYVPTALVWMHPPTTLQDHVHQITRYRGESQPLYSHFSKNLIDSAYTIPKNILMKYKLQVFLMMPFHSIALLLINTYAKYLYTDNYNNIRANWTMITSSKKLHKEKSSI